MKNTKSLTKTFLIAIFAFVMLFAGMAFVMQNNEQAVFAATAYTYEWNGYAWSNQPATSYSKNDTLTFSSTKASPAYDVIVNNSKVASVNKINPYTYTIQYDGATMEIVIDTVDSIKIVDMELKYRVYYNGNAGTDAVTGVPEDNTEYKKNDKATVSTSTPTRLGYKFLGWNTNKNATSALTFENGEYTIESSDVTFYAIWEDLSYGKDIELTIDSFKYNVNSSDIEISLNDVNLEILDYKLWHYNAQNSVYDEVTTMIEPGTYTLNIIIKGKTEDYYFTNTEVDALDYSGWIDLFGDIENYYFSSTNIVATSCDITKTGMEFWGTTSSIASENTVLGVSISLYGSSVTYDSNAGEDSVSNMPEDTNRYLVDAPVTVSTSTLTRNGYEFLGWNTDDSAMTAQSFVNGKYTMTNEDVTFYAIWTPITYNITYNLDSGTNDSNNPATYNIETATITFANPTRTGYTFGGWFSDSDCTAGNEVTTIALGSTGDKELWAKWTATTYTVTYNLKGATGTAPIDNTQYKTGDSVTFKELGAVYYGSVQIGWNTDSTATTPLLSLTIQSDNVTLYAVYSDTPYTNPTKDNDYTVGVYPGVSATYQWYTTNVAGYNNGTAVAGETGTKLNVVPTSGIDYYCEITISNQKFYTNKFSADEYIVRVSSSDEVGKYSIYCFAGRQYTLPANTFVRSGKTFNNWTYNGNDYNVGDKISPVTTARYIEANLVDIHYVVRLNANNGTGTVDSLGSVSTVKDYVLSLTANKSSYSKTGYICQGFALASDSKTYFESYTINPTDATESQGTYYIDLYAIYTPEKYYLIYDSSTVYTNSNNNPTEYNIESETFTLEAPTKTGYTFGGWFSDSNFTAGNEVTTISKGSYGHIYLFPKFTATVYNITYNTDGGEAVTTNLTYTIETETFNLPTTTKENYTLVGWYTDTNYNTLVSAIAKGSTGDRVFYAKWKVNEYNEQIVVTVKKGDTVVDFAKDTLPIDLSTLTFTVNTGLTVSEAKIYDTVTKTASTTMSTASYYYVLLAITFENTENKCFAFSNGWMFSNYKNKNGNNKSLVNGVSYTTYATPSYSLSSLSISKCDSDNLLNNNKLVILIEVLRDAEVEFFSNDKEDVDDTYLGSKIFLFGEEVSYGTTNPTRDGYKFVGWSTDKDALPSSITSKYIINEDDVDGYGFINLYAIWEDLEYTKNVTITISKDLEYGVKKSDISVTVGDSDLKIKEWDLYYAESEESVVTKTNVDIPGSYYIFIVLEGNTKNYWFGNDNGAYKHTATVAKADAIEVYGLYYDNEGTAWVSMGTNGKWLAIAALFTLTGKSVTYDDNVTDSSVSNMPTDANAYLENAPVTVSATIPTRDGYNFLGWNTDKDAKAALTFENNKFAMGTSDVTLYAIWEDKYYSTGFTVTIPTLTKYTQTSDITIETDHDSELTIDSVHFLKPVEPDGIEYTNSISKPGEYIVLVVYTAKSGKAFKKGVYGYVVPYLSCTGCECGGTIVANSFDFTKMYDDEEFMIAGDTDDEDIRLLVFLAIEVEGGNTISFNKNTTETVTGLPESTKYLKDTPVSLPTPSAISGYNFLGWNTDKDAKTALTFENNKFAMGTSDITLYAIWEEKAAVIITETAQEKTYNNSMLAFDLFGTNKDLSGFEVKYFIDNNWTTSAPINAGSYNVKITREEDANYKSYCKEIANGLIINKAKVNEPAVVGTYKYTGNEQTVTLNGVESYMSTTDSLTQTNVGVYTITFTLDNNHDWEIGSDGVVGWEIRVVSISPKTEDPTQEDKKKKVIVETDEGFSNDVTVVVEVTIETEIEQKELSVDYYNLDNEAKLANNEKVGIVFDVKLIQTIGDVSREIQPSDIKAGTKIKVKMLIPETVDISKVTRILHVHSAGDIEEIEFDASKVDENGYYEIEIDRLSEFAFIYQTENQNTLIICVLGGLGLLLIALLLVLFLTKRKVVVIDNEKVVKEFKFRPLQKIDFNGEIKDFDLFVDKGLTNAFTQRKMGLKSIVVYGKYINNVVETTKQKTSKAAKAKK